MTEVDFTDLRWQAFKGGYLAARSNWSYNGIEIGPPGVVEWGVIKERYSQWLGTQEGEDQSPPTDAELVGMQDAGMDLTDQEHRRANTFREVHL